MKAQYFLKTIYLTSIILLFVSCKKNTPLETIFGVETQEIENTKEVKDAKGLFKIKLGKSWKTELYYDNGQSKIYSADTTQNLSSSFIIEATQFDGNLKIDSAFIDKIKTQISSFPRAYVLKSEFLDFKNQKAVCFYSYQKTEERDLFNLQLYIAQRREYYLLESKIFGSENLKKNIQQSVSVFQGFDLITE